MNILCYKRGHLLFRTELPYELAANLVVYVISKELVILFTSRGIHFINKSNGSLRKGFVGFFDYLCYAELAPSTPQTHNNNQYISYHAKRCMRERMACYLAERRRPQRSPKACVGIFLASFDAKPPPLKIMCGEQNSTLLIPMAQSSDDN